MCHAEARSQLSFDSPGPRQGKRTRRRAKLHEVYQSVFLEDLVEPDELEKLRQPEQPERPQQGEDPDVGIGAKERQHL